jgi:hypothetical protein
VAEMWASDQRDAFFAYENTHSSPTQLTDEMLEHAKFQAVYDWAHFRTFAIFCKLHVDMLPFESAFAYVVPTKFKQEFVKDFDREHHLHEIDENSHLILHISVLETEGFRHF